MQTAAGQIQQILLGHCLCPQDSALADAQA